MDPDPEKPSNYLTPVRKGSHKTEWSPCSTIMLTGLALLVVGTMWQPFSRHEGLVSDPFGNQIPDFFGDINPTHRDPNVYGNDTNFIPADSTLLHVRLS